MITPAPDALKLACETLTERDPALARAYAMNGLPVWRSAAPEYATLARTVCYQQITLAAAGTIWGKLQAGLSDVTPDAVLAASDDTLRGFGLSRPKVAHMQSIARAIASGELNLSRVITAPIDDARKELTAVKGIGPWTAEIFLLYTAAKMDAFPIADIGLMEAHKLLTRSDTRMDAKTFTQHAEGWRPYRGVAAHLLWAHLHATRRDSP